MEAATLLPAAPHFFVGYLAAEGEEPYAVRITTASDGCDPAVEGDPRLRAKLAGHEEALEQVLRHVAEQLARGVFALLLLPPPVQAARSPRRGAHLRTVAPPQ